MQGPDDQATPPPSKMEAGRASRAPFPSPGGQAGAGREASRGRGGRGARGFLKRAARVWPRASGPGGDTRGLLRNTMKRSCDIRAPPPRAAPLASAQGQRPLPGRGGEEPGSPAAQGRQRPALTTRSCPLSPSSLSSRQGAPPPPPPSSPCGAESPDGQRRPGSEAGRGARREARAGHAGSRRSRLPANAAGSSPALVPWCSRLRSAAEMRVTAASFQLDAMIFPAGGGGIFLQEEK